MGVVCGVALLKGLMFFHEDAENLLGALGIDRKKIVKEIQSEKDSRQPTGAKSSSTKVKPTKTKPAAKSKGAR